MFDRGWTSLDADSVGLLADPASAGVSQLLLDMGHAARGQSFLEWQRYRDAAAPYDRPVAPGASTDRDRFDGFTVAAARIALVHSITQGTAERLLDHSVVLHDRLPQTLACLRDGVVSPHAVRTVIERTALVDDAAVVSVDVEISESLRRAGSWSRKRLRDMIDRVVFRVDLDVVRDRRKHAVDDRAFWVDRSDDGMAVVGASMLAERAVSMARRVEALARCACRDDPRTLSARKSDALFCLSRGVMWECCCGRDDCDAPAVDEATTVTDRAIPGPATQTVVHVVCDLETVAGCGENPGFLDGHGVISADHVRQIVAGPDVRIAPLGGSDEPLTASQPGAGHRPTAALDAFVRVRGLYCSWPGCEQSAWRADLDHVHEYDHEDPAHGGQTCPDVLDPKCRFHHGVKTFTDLLDDQRLDDAGRIVRVVTTPEGLDVPGPAFTGEDLIPGLADIRFSAPPHAPPDTASVPAAPADRRRTRLADRHARRRQERERNQRRRERPPMRATADPDDEPPPF